LSGGVEITVMTGPSDVKGILTSIEKGFKNYPRMSWSREHLLKTHHHLVRVHEALIKLKVSVEKKDPSTYIVAANELKNASTEATQLNKAKEEIMKKYNMSDEEVGYRYRSR
jgi:hypothetical protein